MTRVRAITLVLSVLPDSLGMTHANRFLNGLRDGSTGHWAGLLGAGAVLLSANLAGAALAEYHMRFTPSESPGVAGYTMHLGTRTGDYIAEFDLGNPASPGGEIVYGVAFDNAIDLYIAISAYDAEGAASEVSNEVAIPRVVPTDPPSTSPPSTEPPNTGGGSGEPGTGGSGGSSGSGGEPGSGGSGEEPTPPVLTGERVFLGMMASDLGELMAVDQDGAMKLLMVDSLVASGDVRPAHCDLDGDGDLDLVVGYGAGGGGQVSVLHLEDGDVVSNVSLTAGSSRYRSSGSGMTYPSCGDIDGDGLPEIVVGFDEGMGGRLQFFDDETTAFWPFRSDATNRQGYLRLFASGEERLPLFPAVGDVDGDGRAEVLAGTGPGVGARLFILDDAEAGFEPHPSVASGQNAIYPLPVPHQDWQENIERRVATGDVDGDGLDEIVVSFGETGGGQIFVLDDLRWQVHKRGTKNLGMIRAGREANREDSGATRVSLGDIDEDGVDEFIVGFDGVGGDEIQVFDDSLTEHMPYFTMDGFVTPVDGEEGVVPTAF